jgi:hypothetical protein
VCKYGDMDCEWYGLLTSAITRAARELSEQDFYCLVFMDNMGFTARDYGSVLSEYMC